MIESGPKVRVVTAYGSSALGEMDPKVNMVVDAGVITSVSLPNVEVSGVTAGVTTTTYFPAQLNVLQSEASGAWSWPSGDGSVVFGHAGVFPDGVPLASPTVSALVFMPDGSYKQVNR